MNCSDCKNNGTQICSVCCSYQGYPDRWEPKPKTNADRIRAMSDEELADFLEKVADGCDSCPMLKECTYSDGEMSEEQVRLMWLKQEAEE